MRIAVAALATASGLCGGALAADKPVIAPIPSWVSAISPPADRPSVEQGAVRILLSDQQTILKPGEQSTFFKLVIKIETSQGLTAGNISLPWRPDTDTLTVHNILIRRGKQVIDVLASGQTFTVIRRETALETAILDGVLTANIQPEGLQVGDIVELAASVTTRDPVLKGHVEQTTAAWNGVSIDRAHLRVQWPATLPVRFKQTVALPALKPTRTGETGTLELGLDDVKPVVAPKGAPARYKLGRRVDLTDFATWSDAGALLAPLYQRASVLPAQGPLQAEVARIRALSLDPKTRAEAALALVQDRVRYVALAMGAGGLVPADAETTWSRRFGDCKGKTALLLALLHALEIEAEPVLVSSTLGDGLNERLPMLGLFDHVLVRAIMGGRTYWLDGTRSGQTSLDRLAIPAFGWGLPLLSSGAALVRMVPAPLQIPSQDVSIRIDATAGLTAPAPTRVEAVLRGDEAAVVTAGLGNLTGDARDRALREYWKQQFDFIDIKTAGATFDAKSGEQRLTMEGEARLDWAGGSYFTDQTSVGYKADFTRGVGEDRDAPFEVPFPYFFRTRETILLPKGVSGFKIGPGMDVDQTAGGIKYKRSATLNGQVFTVEKTERSLVPEFSAKEALMAQASLRTLAGKSATLVRPSGYKPTDSDLAAARARAPSTTAEFVNRAKLLLGRGLRAEAIEDYGRAIKLDSNNAMAWANRGMTRVQVGDLAGAKADLDAADKLDRDNLQALIGRGMLAEAQEQPKEAIAAYTRALEVDADSTFAVARRAFSYSGLRDYDHAFADAGRAIKLDPTWIDLYALRAGIMLLRGEKDRAVREMEAAIAVRPDRAFAHVSAARIYAASNRLPEAVAAYGRALSLEPTALAYAERSRVRPAEDVKGRLADVEAALKLDAKSADAWAAKARLQQDQGDVRAAIASWSQAVAAAPTATRLIADRARARYELGDHDLALQDAKAAIRLDPKLTDLYLLRANIFRSRGSTAEALAEAAAVVAANPDDTYAHVAAAKLYGAYYKTAEAMRAYERALAIKPEAFIYLNRSEQRPKADRAARRADVEAALRLDPTLTEALTAKAELQSEDGDHKGAINVYSLAIAKAPDNQGLRVDRGIAYARSGQAALAERDFADARAKVTEANGLNNICMSKAIAGVALDSALADCNAALAKEPNSANILDSRGFVLLRLGRLDGALTDYNRALVKSPKLVESLFGRAVVWARKGDRAKSSADAAKALEIDPDVKTRFEAYGVKL